jgi:superfamily II DNA or RNA helicase
MDNNQTYEELVASFKNSYLDKNEGIASSSGPSFVYNSPEEKKTVLDSIIKNLKACDSFLFSVAFITEGGLVKLKMVLKELADCGIKGRIITTNYLNFSDPKALLEIANMPNIELRMFYISDNEPGFHTKGYIFHYPNDTYHTIIGSSNLTSSALLENNEWNNEMVCFPNGEIIQDILKQFEINWKNSVPILDVIKTYQDAYNKAKEAAIKPDKYSLPFIPNAMQSVFVTRWNELIAEGKKRGIFIAATGSGKTCATAFGLKSMVGIPHKRVLYVTHRELILKQAIESYQLILGSDIKYTLLSGNSHEDGDFNYYFATKETLAKDKYLRQFTPDFFDIVIIDEVHKVGEKNQYQNIIKYFTPHFLLGMSATPFRTDGYDLYAQFDHNIVYNIDLEDSLKAKMICPFDYFGICDLTNNGKAIDDLSTFTDLTSDERVNNIVWQSKYYGYSGDRLKGLIFVSRVDVGKELSEKLNQRGYKTIFLDGSTPSDKRDEAIKKLESDNPDEDHYDFILTVDIFNEGVDIPSVNQVILLRPTQSAIVFLQQLGRGLRLCDNKEFVVVLDFIGNYKENFNIALALHQKVSSKTGALKRPTLPPPSTVQFDHISNERLFDSIHNTKLFAVNNIKIQYYQIKSQLGYIPSLIAFDKYGKLTSRAFLDYKVVPSYYDFLCKYDKSYLPRLSPRAVNILQYSSKYFCNGLRIHECLLLRCLLTGHDEDFFISILKKYNCDFSPLVRDSVIHLLDRSFAKGTYKPLCTDKYSLIQVVNNKICLSHELLKECENQEFLKRFNEIISYGIYSAIKYFNPSKYFSTTNCLIRYVQYNKLDACRLMNYDADETSTMFGYRANTKVNLEPLFVTLQKNLDENSSTNYLDAFIGTKAFRMFSRSRNTISNKEIIQLTRYCREGRSLLFVKKADSNNAEEGYIFIGSVSLAKEPENDKMRNGLNIVRYEFKIDKEVRTDVYDDLQTPLTLSRPSKKA